MKRIKILGRIAFCKASMGKRSVCQSKLVVIYIDDRKFNYFAGNIVYSTCYMSDTLALQFLMAGKGAVSGCVYIERFRELEN